MTGSTQRLRCGFTLVELLAVMAIIAVMGAIITVSYFGMTRGAALRSAVNHLRSTFLLARQAAVMDGKTTYVIFDERGYGVCQAQGRMTYGGGLIIGDRYADWSDLSAGVYIFNLDARDGASSRVADTPRKEAPSSGGKKIWMLRTETAIYQHLSRYGWETYPKNFLPKGMEWKRYEKKVVFRPDGTIDEPGGYEFLIIETIDPDYVATVRVKYPTGFVEVEMK